ncbi:MAG: CRISPR type I-E protein CasA/Cse1 [Candidatus Accumulibacter appositus]|uniref:CRISPR type I-E protein CasA/Cse1 n=1 Tax=Candidatus Accumulibacter appositus TaxID=1454003 RepID=A0A011Q2B6_9PROT|nr:type I-E CRISPR-associated protein Cse1/CasA [Accumulibacter sp.]EXI83377.1 MAG: CRISPR type I-E protein CasA/Cse1 [Candidatus Accumulibacter appositus]HRF06896.1 type I-E CRISPR-associated protein Cse1/CasA [Accumulibacter sp.]
MTLLYNLLDEPLIRTRLVADGQPRSFSLPGLFVALGHDAVRDFPALRPHQRHPWHAFLVQLAAIALHRAGQSELFDSEATWKQALLDLTPEHPDGAAWCLIAPHDRPAFMQAPVPGGKIDDWKNTLRAADELDMLVTSKNHDLKSARMRHAEPDDWVMALISIQTQEGFLGAGNYGISRMNGGFASRPAIGVVPKGHWGQRWARDVRALLTNREAIVDQQGLKAVGGLSLVWLQPWDGEASLPFCALDPWYIEICRRIRLVSGVEIPAAYAIATGSKVARIDAKSRNGLTGDPWMPIDIAAEKALTINAEGFHYRLAAELLFGNKFYRPVAQIISADDGAHGLVVLTQGVTRGQGKTEGYHERRVPISPKVCRFMLQQHTDLLAKVASERVSAISQVRSVLWTALAALFDKGSAKDKFSDSAKNKASDFSKPFEQSEDARFFIALNEEIESNQPDEQRLKWLSSMADVAEAILKHAFTAGPQCGEQRYRAQAAALSRFHSGLRNPKTLPDLANHLRQRSIEKELS